MRTLLAILFFVTACGQMGEVEAPDMALRFLAAKCNVIQLPAMPDVKVWPDGFKPVRVEPNCGLTSADKETRWANFYVGHGASIQDEYGRQRAAEEVKCVDGVPTLTLDYKVQVVGFQLTYTLYKPNESFACWVPYFYVDYMSELVKDGVCRLRANQVSNRKVICRWDSYP